MIERWRPRIVTSPKAAKRLIGGRNPRKTRLGLPFPEKNAVKNGMRTEISRIRSSASRRWRCQRTIASTTSGQSGKRYHTPFLKTQASGSRPAQPMPAKAAGSQAAHQVEAVSEPAKANERSGQRIEMPSAETTSVCERSFLLPPKARTRAKQNRSAAKVASAR